MKHGSNTIGTYSIAWKVAIVFKGLSEVEVMSIISDSLMRIKSDVAPAIVLPK